MTSLLVAAVPVSGAIASRILGAARAASIMFAVAIIDAVLSVAMAFFGPAAPTRLSYGYIVVDPTSRLFVLLINLIFVGIAGHVWRRVQAIPALREHLDRFVGFCLAFIAAANLAVLSNHFVAGWLCLEITSLAAAPLIAHSGTAASLRASWRYFLFSSVGLGLALLGFACLSRSIEAAGLAPSFFLDRLPGLISTRPDAWRELGLALLFLGYGTKLGLAPMYSWLPEAYDEAPPTVTALLAGVQFNCAIVGVFRILEVYRDGETSLVGSGLVAMGLASMAVSTFSIIATRNYKRLIAYASINHAGVIAIGLGIGRSASYGLVLYVVSNAFIKVILFLTAGKIDDHYKTKDMREVTGLIKDLPASGVFLMVGTFALLGFPPFGSFLGELIILSGLMSAGYVLVFVAFCSLLTVTFVAMGRSVFPMIWGTSKHPASTRQGPLSAPFKIVFIIALLVMGVYLPRSVSALFVDVAASLGGR